jgi:hypothetical protein
MKHFLRILFCQIFIIGGLQAQLITSDPIFPHQDEAVTIIFDATQGNAGLADCGCDVYVHTGVITDQSTSPSDWKHVVTSWGVANDAWKMTPVPGQPNKYSFTIEPTIDDYYGVNVGEIVEELAFVFRNASGNLVGKDAAGMDIFYPVYASNGNLLTTFLAPDQTLIIASEGLQIPVTAVASADADLVLMDNGAELISLANTDVLNYNLIATGAGLHDVMFSATSVGGGFASSTFSYIIPNPVQVFDPPAGTKLGATYLDDTSVRLRLHAPDKSFIFVLGDFNNWVPNLSYQMKRSVNGEDWWLDIFGLTPGQYYRFQYLVDGDLQIADPCSELILDPQDDPFIPEVTFPNLPFYPAENGVGNVSLLRPGFPVYDWQVNDFDRPENTDLVVYEMLARDFVARHDYETIMDTLDYLQRLGINTIELMPVNEFEGNNSWGYNPSFHMALDKYYGTPESFKALVDACHERGIAVVLDVVFNHAFGESPLARLYWNAAQSQPAADNPWLNPVATHPFNVGYDFNHESPATKEYVKRCLEYWLTEYRVDGFRFDLSKGFTQVNYGTGDAAVGPWSQYDASRIAILKDYADFVWSVSGDDTYVILEHLSVNEEEKELGQYGMLLWGNLNHDYNEASMGWTGNSLSWINYKFRGWTVPHVVGYMESHDEERLAYKNLQFGNSSGGYSVKDSVTALQRNELASAFFYTVPGPKMLWQFGELGYDYSINYCPNGSISSNCRTDPKPIRWNYYDVPRRRKLFDVTSALIHLKTTYDVFSTTDYTAAIGAGYKKRINLNSDDMNVTVLGNFNVLNENIIPTFQHTGWWYEYFSGDSLDVTDVSATLAFLPGEYRLYTDVKLPEPPGGYTEYTLGTEDLAFWENLDMNIFPNPTSGDVTVSFQLPESAQVNIGLFSVTGQLITTVVNGRLMAGEHQMNIEQELTPGVYLVRLAVDGKVRTGKLVVTD